ncbi:meiotic recombination protein rec12 [Apiospora arundinis]|uniref:DNA topoisomerase (ATP-hydrolyzing) n=1 Tax=Apiospora arundinis TaxID=335852 RepID=A0ABR2I355_9PEZI
MNAHRSRTSLSFGAFAPSHEPASSQALFSEDSQGLVDATHDDGADPSNDRVTGHRSVVEKIEDIVESVVDAMSENRPLTLPLRSRPSGNEFVVSFPSTHAAGVKKFVCLMFLDVFEAASLQVLFLCRQALVSGTVITKRLLSSFPRRSDPRWSKTLDPAEPDQPYYRSIYYQNPELFGSQNYVDRLVDDIAFTLGVGRHELNIVAASKGLVAGQSFTPENGEPIVVVPPAEAVINFDLRSVGWILVIEKEATFRSLVSLRYHEQSAAGPGILMTAKGYPDLASRQFLHRVNSSWPQIPIYALMDFDPDGVSIMRTYKHGSLGMRHEQSVTVPGLIWLGVKHNDLLDLPMRFLPSVASESQESQSTLISSQNSNVSSSRSVSRTMSGSSRRGGTGWKVISMSRRDRAKAVRLLSTLNEHHQQDADEMELASELQLMLMLNMKFEIQAIHEVENMAYWLDERLSRISDWV